MRRLGWGLGVAVLAGLLLVSPARGQAPEPVRYTLSFPEPQTHYVQVEAVFPTDRRDDLELMMAVWTPGSYLVREFSRHVENLQAHTMSGDELTVESTRKNRWRVASQPGPPVVVSYRVYSHEMTVRTNWVDTRFALINGAATYLTLAEDAGRPHHVTLDLPTSWARSVTSLPPDSGGRPHTYRAPDFATLVDSPIVAGNPSVHEFRLGGVPHALVNVGDETWWDGQRAAADVERIVSAHHELWEEIPYERFVFLNLITEAGGGIEHQNSTVLMTSRWAMQDRERYLRWLTLVSHELFHAWNGKRLRPVELGPFDYETEVYTRSLWVVEGLTDYYGPLLVHRAGLSTRSEYLEELSEEIHALQTTPGRLLQSVEQASFDAWIKFYRRNENSANTTVSYYTKGAVIGFLLDAAVRRRTGGARSLDDGLRLAYARYSGERGFTPAEFRSSVEDAAANDVDLGRWFATVLETAAELDYREALDWFGLELTTPETPVGDDQPSPAWLGVTTAARGSRAIVTGVERDSPGYQAGLSPDDEILAVDAYRVLAGELDRRLASYRPGQSVSVLVSRRGALQPVTVTLGARSGTRWALGARRLQTTAQRLRMDAWLGPRDH